MYLSNTEICSKHKYHKNEIVRDLIGRIEDSELVDNQELKELQDQIMDAYQDSSLTIDCIEDVCKYLSEALVEVQSGRDFLSEMDKDCLRKRVELDLLPGDRVLGFIDAGNIWDNIVCYIDSKEENTEKHYV